MSADVDTVREALVEHLFDTDYERARSQDALGALDRLASIEAQRDALAEALRRIADAQVATPYGNVMNATKARKIARAALVAVARAEETP